MLDESIGKNHYRLLKVLEEFGMAPPILSKIKSMILSNISNNYNGENRSYAESNKVDEEINLLRIQRHSAKSGNLSSY